MRKDERKLKIGLDFDGVISDSMPLKSRLAKEIYEKEIPAYLFKREYVVGKGFLTNEEYNNLQNMIYGTEEYGLLPVPINGLIKHVTELLKIGHEVKVITSRTGPMADIARKWLDTYNLPISVEGVGKGISKREAAKGLDIYIDDDFDKLEPLIGTVPHLFIFSWEHNAHIVDNEHIQRVFSWREFYNRIRGIH